MAGFEKAGGLIRQLSFTSREKGALGALQVISVSQPIIDKWVKNKFGSSLVVCVVAFSQGLLSLEARNGLEVVEIRRNSKGLMLQLNKSLGRGLVKKINVKVKTA